MTDTTYNLYCFCPPGNGGTEGGVKTIEKNPKADKGSASECRAELAQAMPSAAYLM